MPKLLQTAKLRDVAPRPGPKVPTPRSAKQQAQAKAWNNSTGPITAPKPEPAAPASSWWTECRSREEFDRKVEERRHQMNPSTLPGVKYQGSGIGE